MCGRIRLESDWSEIVRVFELTGGDPIEDWVPRYNIAPTQRVPILTGPRGARRARWGSWGFVPLWEQSAKPKQRPINARAETVAESGMFKQAFRERRCLVPATGFYEWRAEADGKQPFLFAQPNHAPFALAGIWQRWTPEGGAPVDTFTVLTTPPNVVTERVHDRMPVILPTQAAIDLWTDPTADPASLAALLRPAPDDFLGMWPVSRAMNAASRESAADAAILA